MRAYSLSRYYFEALNQHDNIRIQEISSANASAVRRQNLLDISGWTGRCGLSDFLEVMGNFVDVAKIATLNAIVLPDSYLKDTLRQYDGAGVQTFAGGLLFEYAYLKNEIDGLIERLNYLNLGGIEVSENYITLKEDERDNYIGMLIDAGLEVVFEYGHKYPEKPMDLTALEAVI